MKISTPVPRTFRRCVSKVLALTASPAGELTVLDTVVKIEELLDRLGADLVAPVGGREEVMNFVDVRVFLFCLRFPAAGALLVGCLRAGKLPRGVVPACVKVCRGSAPFISGAIMATRLPHLGENRRRGVCRAHGFHAWWIVLPMKSEASSSFFPLLKAGRFVQFQFACLK